MSGFPPSRPYTPAPLRVRLAPSRNPPRRNQKHPPATTSSRSRRLHSRRGQDHARRQSPYPHDFPPHSAQRPARNPPYVHPLSRPLLPRRIAPLACPRQEKPMTDQTHITTHAAERGRPQRKHPHLGRGVLKPKNEAVVSVYDSGFMLGDGVLGRHPPLMTANGPSSTNTSPACSRPPKPSTSTSPRTPDLGHRRRAGDAGGKRHDHRRPHCRLMVTRGGKSGLFNNLRSPARAPRWSSSWNIPARKSPAPSASPPSPTCAACP